MDKSKYIVFESELCLPTPIIFPVWLTHSDVARSLTGGDLDKVLSAGFVTVTPKRDFHAFLEVETDGIQVDCFGRSESLDLEAKESDGALVARVLGIEVFEETGAIKRRNLIPFRDEDGSE